jgi:hypothetical protein
MVVEERVHQGRVEAVVRCGSAVLSGNSIVVVRGAGLTELSVGGGLLVLGRLDVNSLVRRLWLSLLGCSSSPSASSPGAAAASSSGWSSPLPSIWRWRRRMVKVPKALGF